MARVTHTQRRSRRKAAQTALLFAIACLTSSARAATQDPGTDVQGGEVAVDTNLFSIPETLLVRALYDRARGHLEARRWNEAIADLQSILEDHRGDVLPAEKPRSKSGRLSEAEVHAGAAVRARALLAAMPQEARKLYRDRFENDAMRALEAARARRDARALGEVGRRYSLCEAAERAFLSLGDLELELGHDDEARYAWERALRLRLLDPLLSLSTAADWKAARDRVKTAAGAPDDASKDAAGKSDASGLLARIDFAHQRLSAGETRATLAAESQRSVRLPAAHEMSGPPPGEGADAWSQPYRLPNHPWDSAATRDALFPVRSGDTLLVSTSLRVIALHAYTGEPLWDSGEPDGWSRLSSTARTELFLGVDADSALIAPAVSGSVVVASLQLPFGLLRKDNFQQIQITVPIPERRLFAWDVDTGRKLWDHTPPPGWDGDGGSFQDRMSIAGPPVIAGSRVLAPCVRMQGRIYYNVGCFDLETGALLWSSDVISGQRELNMFGRAEHEFCAAPLRVEGDKVVAVTQLGTVACLDLFSGEILWETLHETITMPRTRQFYAPKLPANWRNTPPVVESGVVLATPTNCPELIALDLKSGALLWSIPHRVLCNLVGRQSNSQNPTDLLLGAAPDAIYLRLSSDKVVALDMPGGLAELGRVNAKWTWREENNLPTLSGRPVVCADRIVVPRVSERVEIDRLTGNRLATIRWPGASIGGNLLIGSGEMFVVSGKSVQGFFEWDVLVGRARADLLRAPQDAERVLVLARLLDGRGSSEWQKGAFEPARAHFTEARTVLERALSGASGDDARATLRPEYHSVLRGEARVRAALLDMNGAIANLRAARPVAPDPASLRDTLLEELAILRDRANTPAADPTAVKNALDELERSCAELTVVTERLVAPGTGETSFFGQRYVPIVGRAVRDDGVPIEMPVGLWVLLERAEMHDRARDVAGLFADLHAMIDRWHGVELADGTAGDLAAEHIGALLSAGKKAGYEEFEGRAQSLFDAGVRAHDGAALERVSRLYPHSRAARAANDARLDIALEKGEVATVARIVESELPDDWDPENATEREALLWLRLGAALTNAGNVEAGGALLRALSERHGALVSDLPQHAGATLRELAEKAPVFAAFSRATDVGRFRREPETAFDRLQGDHELLGEPLPGVPVQDLEAGRPSTLIFARNPASARSPTTILELDSEEAGASRWTFDVPAAARPASTGSGFWNRRNAFAAGRLMLATAEGVLAIDTSGGTRAWEWEPGDGAPDSLSIACTSGVAVVVVTPRAERERWYVVGLDAHSGAELWRTGAMEALVSRMPLVSGTYAVLVPQSGQKQVLVLDLFTGTRVRRFDLDVAAPSGMLDQDAWIEGDRLIVPGVNEVRLPDRNRIAAFDLRTGARAWRVPIDDSPGAGRKESPVKRSLRGILQQSGRTWLLLQSTTEPGAYEQTLCALDTKIGALTPLSSIRVGGEDRLMGLPRASRIEMPKGPIFLLSPRTGRGGVVGEARLRCIDLDRGELWVQALGFGFDQLAAVALPMPALSETSVAVAWALSEQNTAGASMPSYATTIRFFDIQSGALGGTRDLPPRREKDVPQLVPLGDTLIVRTRHSLEVLK